MNWLFQFLTLIFCLGPGNTISQSNSNPLKVDGVLGESATLPPEFSTKLTIGMNVESITWLHKGKSIAFIMLKSSEAQQISISITDPKRRSRLKITNSYSLEISKLETTDAGLYKAQIVTNDSIVFSDYILNIFRRLSNIQITNHTQLSEDGICKVYLACSVENPDNSVSFGWQDSGSTSLKEVNVTLSWDPKNTSEQNIYTCVAENPISNLSSSVSLQSLCKGLVENPFPIALIIAIPMIVLLLGAIVLFLLLRGKKGVLWFSTQQTQQPADSTRNIENGSFSQGNTVYAQVTHSNRNTEIQTPTKNNDSSTVYSTIQQSKETKTVSR